MRTYIAVLAFLFGNVAVNAQSVLLSLQDAQNMGKTSNRSRQIGLLEQERLDGILKESKAGLLPSVALNSSYNAFGTQPVIYLRDEASTHKASPVRYGGKYAFDASVTMSYQVLNPQSKSAIRTARVRQKLQLETQKGNDEFLILSISDLYYSILLKKQQLQLLSQSLDRNSRSLRDARSLFLQGKALKTDTLATYLAIQNVNATILEVRNDYQKLQLDLKQLLGLDLSTDVVLIDSLTASENILSVSSAHYSIALEERSDIRASILQLDLLKEERKGRLSLFKPQVLLLAQYQIQNQAEQVWLSGTQMPNTSFLGLRLNVPIYSGQKAQHVKHQYATATRQQQLVVEEMKAQVEKELITVKSDLDEAVNQWKIQQVSMQSAEMNYNMLYERYKQGLSTRLEVTDAELSLTSAKMNAAEAAYLIRLQELRYMKALGSLDFTVSR